MSTRTRADARAWVDYGTELVNGQLASLSEEEFNAPCGLPGWSRKNLVAHLSGNAEAIGNLLRWAATGEPTPMYASPEAGVGFDDLPADFLVALCDDIAAKRDAAASTDAEGPALTLAASDADLTWQVAGSGAPTTVTGTVAALTTYLAGRGSGSVSADGDVPELPAWL